MSEFTYDSSAQYLFNRVYSLSIAPPKQTAAKQYGNIGPNAAPLHIRFDIQRGYEDIGQAKIEIFNLSAASQSSYQHGYFVQLRAGYNNLSDILFTGVIIKAESKRDGASFVTSLECGDGESQITYNILDKSYPAGIHLLYILQDVAHQMSVDMVYSKGIEPGIVRGLPNIVYNKGFMATGRCADTLDKLLRPRKLSWNVHNGTLNIIPKTASNGRKAIVMSSENGMIGIPSFNNGILKFTALLNPNLIPEQAIQMVSRKNTICNGIFKIQKSHFDADTHDTKWQVDCEAVPLPAAEDLGDASGFNYLPALRTDNIA